jgi:hypothetical protein
MKRSIQSMKDKLQTMVNKSWEVSGNSEIETISEKYNDVAEILEATLELLQEAIDRMDEG